MFAGRDVGHLAGHSVRGDRVPPGDQRVEPYEIPSTVSPLQPINDRQVGLDNRVLSTDRHRCARLMCAQFSPHLTAQAISGIVRALPRVLVVAIVTRAIEADQVLEA